MIGIVDYGLSNLTSVAGAIEKLGYECVITDSADTLQRSRKLILPGVGAFGDGIRKLRERGLADALTDLVIEDGIPIRRICLGCQLMTQGSDEFGTHEGLGWFAADTVGFKDWVPIFAFHVG